MTHFNYLSTVRDSVSYANQFRGCIFLIKLGGSILNDEKLIVSLCDDLKFLQESGIKFIIVHGGSKAINRYLAINNIQSEFIDGLRVTSIEAMQIIEMVLCGHVNNLLVRKLNSVGMRAIGLSGTDNQLLQCQFHGGTYGYVGSINSVNTAPILHLLSYDDKENYYTPVIAPVGVDHKGNAFNINADYAASYIATQMKVNKLIYLTDQDGIYDKNGQVYSELSENQLRELIANNTVQGGMLAKAKAILSALQGELNNIHVLNGTKKNSLIEEIFTPHGIGTLCKSEKSNNKQLETIS